MSFQSGVIHQLEMPRMAYLYFINSYVQGVIVVLSFFRSARPLAESRVKVPFGEASSMQTSTGEGAELAVTF